MTIFKIQGSGDNQYQVHVGPKGDELITIACDCKAGIFGRMCKHKLAVATGDPSLLLDKNDAKKLAEIAGKINQRPIGELLRNLAASKREHEASKRKMDKARKKLETAMKG